MLPLPNLGSVFLKEAAAVKTPGGRARITERATAWERKAATDAQGRLGDTNVPSVCKVQMSAKVPAVVQTHERHGQPSVWL